MNRRILIVAPFAPAQGGRHGGARAIHGIVRELAQRHEVVVVHLDDGQIDPDIASRCAVHVIPVSDPGPWGVRFRGASMALRGRSLKAAASEVGQVTRRVRHVAETFRPHIVQVEFSVLGEALRGAGDAVRVVTVHDPAASLGESLPLRPDGLPFVHRVNAVVARREERRVLGRADAAVVFTERDRILLKDVVGGGTRLVTIPLGWDVPDEELDPVGSGPPTLLFIGSFDHPPNVEAAKALVQRILPHVRAEHSDVRVELVGSAPTLEVRALAGDGVEVTGEVTSVVPHLDRAAVVVAPISFGGGMRVKVLEALAAGKAVVASSRAAEGVTARPGEDLIVVDSDIDAAAAMNRLLADDDARRRMAGRARAWAVRELSWSVMADRYEDLYERADHRGRATVQRGG